MWIFQTSLHFFMYLSRAEKRHRFSGFPTEDSDDRNNCVGYPPDIVVASNCRLVCKPRLSALLIAQQNERRKAQRDAARIVKR